MSRIIQTSVFNLPEAVTRISDLDVRSPALDLGASREKSEAGSGSKPSLPGNPSELPVTTYPRSGRDSQFLQEATKLVYKLFRTAGEPELSSVLFCGIDQANNSSTICARAGEILAAQVQKSVCVVDANFRSPSMHIHFGLKNQRGFADALLEPGQLRGFAQQQASGNLWVMTAGAAPSDGMVLSSGVQLRSRMLELRALFDYVLVDVAPAGLFMDAIVLGQLVDGAVLVIESNSTKREIAFQAKEALEAARVRILGAVLHSRKTA